MRVHECFESKYRTVPFVKRRRGKNCAKYNINRLGISIFNFERIKKGLIQYVLGFCRAAVKNIQAISEIWTAEKFASIFFTRSEI